MKQPGRTASFTAAQIREIRQAWWAHQMGLRQREEVIRRFGMQATQFNRYGSGEYGKKPKAEKPQEATP